MTILSDKIFGTFLGIEFRDESAVITCLQNSISGIVLLSSSTFSLKDDHETLISDINKYVDQHCADVNKVFVSIPDKWAIIRFIDIPLMKGKAKGALINMVRFEIERHIPYEIEDVAYDFLLMDETDMSRSVVFAAVQKKHINFVKEFLEELSLQPHAITVSSFAVLNAIELGRVRVGGWQEMIGIVRKTNDLGKKGETNVFLYIDATNAGVALIRDGVCIHLRSFTFDMPEPSDEWFNGIAEYISDIQSRYGIDNFDKLILASDTPLAASASEKMKEKLNIDAVYVNPLSGIAKDIKGININDILSSVGSCFAGLGLGTYKINLLPHKIKFGIKKIAPLTSKLLLILILIMLIGLFTTDAVKKKRFYNEMEKILQKNRPGIEALEKLSSEKDSLKARNVLLQNIRKNEITLEILAELTKILPGDSWITSLHFKGFDVQNKKKEGGELVISGFAASSSMLIPLLEDSRYFEKVEFVGSIKKTRDKEQFKLRAQVIKPVKNRKSGK